jgi:hypothetical protein
LSKPKIQVVFRTERMTNSTELKRLLRAVETTYYLSLFVQEEYAQRPDVWRKWAHIGFATGLQEGPLEAYAADGLNLTTFTDGKTLTFTAKPGNLAAASEWVEVLEEVESLRQEVSNLSAAERSAVLSRVGRIKDRMIDAVGAAIAGIPADERDTINRGRDQALESLTFPIINVCAVSEKES